MVFRLYLCEKVYFKYYNFCENKDKQLIEKNYM